MYMPAEYYNEHYRSKKDDYEGFTFGDDSSDDSSEEKPYEKPIQRPKSPPLDNIRLLDERLYHSIMNGDADRLDELLKIHTKRNEFCINSSLKNGYSLLMNACQNGQYDIVEILLKHNANPNAHNELHSPIMAACNSSTNMTEQHRIVEKFLQLGVTVNQSDRCGVTPLMYACISGNVNIVKSLIKLADLNMADNRGNTALIHAVENNHCDVVRLLLAEENIQKELSNSAGFTPKNLAMFSGSEEMAELFPQEDSYTIPTEYLTINHYEDMAPTIFQRQQKPPYFLDVRSLLLGMECEKFLPQFAQACIGLGEMLNISDDRLNDIGIMYPFERKRIFMGLRKFHHYQWSPWTIKSLTQKQKQYSSIYDLYCLFAGHLRYLIVLRESLHYVYENIKNRHQGLLTDDIVKQIQFLTKEIQDIIKLISNFKRHIQYFENYQAPKPPLFIEDVTSKPFVTASRCGKVLKTIVKCSTIVIGFGLIVYWKRR